MFSCIHDVCVVGGGPAGLAAAIALRRESCHVTVVDCAVPPIDKACGEGLMPDSLAALRELGIEIPSDQGFLFRGIRFASGTCSVEADFPNGAAKGIRRTTLHDLLVRRAESLGIAVLWNAKHVRLLKGGISLDGRLVKAQLVVGADGQNSQIRGQAKLHRIERETRRYGFRRHYRIAPWSPYMELHWGRRCQIYITPVAGNEICVATISRDPALRLEQALTDFPELMWRLANASPVSEEKGAISVSRKLRAIQRNEVALLGDASGSVDAITGEGMCLGFRQALALAQAVRSGDLPRYRSLHHALMRRPRAMASLMLTLDRHSQIQRRVLAGFSQHPQLFQSLLAIHVGDSSFRDLWSWRLLNFGRAFLTA